LDIFVDEILALSLLVLVGSLDGRRRRLLDFLLALGLFFSVLFIEFLP